MPLYTLACRRSLDAATRQRVARAVTDAHCATTGAPPEFVSVLHLEGYPLAGDTQVAVLGGVRRGGNRDDAVLQRLQEAVRDAVAGATGFPAARVGVELVGFAASWVMEGGEILPEPGEEGAHALTPPGPAGH